MKLTETTLRKLTGKKQRYEVRDDQIANLWLRIYPSGRQVWVLRYRADNRSKRFRIGDASSVSPTQARRRAKTLGGEIANGGDPNREKTEAKNDARRSRAATLRSFLVSHYQPWVTGERKTGAATVKRIKSNFAHLMDTGMDQLTSWQLERWRKEKHEAGRTPETTNRDLTALKACLSKAVEWRIIDSHPLKDLKPRRTDKTPPIRLLTVGEEERLRKALKKRDAAIRQRRKSGNSWRKDRRYETYPEYGKFADHLEPVVLLALNTGMRRGEILNIRWSDISQDSLTVRGGGSKTEQSRIIPLNAEAKDVLNNWQSDGPYVFPGRGESPITTIKRSWDSIRKSANLPKLRLHDLRHTFATKLLQKGADIRTVSSLLGHKDISITARYLHSTDESMRRAVELL